MYIPLHNFSAYSLAEGAIPIKSLIKRCKEYKIPAVAVTDRNNLFGAMEFAMEAAKAGIQPILGCTLTLLDPVGEIVVLVQTEEGYRNLCGILSDCYMNPEDDKQTGVTLNALRGRMEGLFVLTAGTHGAVEKLLQDGRVDAAEQVLSDMKDITGGNMAVEIVRYDGAAKTESQLVALADRLEVPLVATNPAWFLDASQHIAHDALLCIAEGRYVSETDRRRVPQTAYLRSEADMIAIFRDLPDALENTVRIAQSCSFLLKEVKTIFPAFPTQDGRNEDEELRVQAQLGFAERMKRVTGDQTPYRERLEFELNMILQMGFAGYFLIVSDFIKWAKNNRIPVGPGRGSGAGSVVAWALAITDLDPIQFNLLFERFLNPERVSLPDFDIDFCQERRDEVIAYVQQRYGRDRVAQIITFGKLQARAVIRDVGRVLQLPYGQVDRIAKMIPNNPAKPTTLQEALDGDPQLQAVRDGDETVGRLITIALQLEGLYRHASTHAAGIVIGPRPLHEIVPLYRDPKSDMAVTQFNMKVIEQAGLIKFDFLGLKTMTVIQHTLDLLDNGLSTLDIPLDDQKTFDMLARGETTGVFQLESAGMRDLGKQMKINNFEQLSALVALFRPGPMENIPRYLACLHGQEERNYMHEKLQPVTESTYGVMIYQEQVMQAAQVLAGYTLGQADLLRRAMGKKIPEEMKAERTKFVKGAAEFSNIPEGRANDIFDQIDKFAGYGFNKAHSACYALISYWTAYLKANFPIHFMCASMILDQGNTDKLSVFNAECKRMGITLLPPDVNHSMVDFAIECLGCHPDENRDLDSGLRRNDNSEAYAIRYGLSALKGAGAAAMGDLVAERENGLFSDLNNFLERLPAKAINKKQLESLIAAGALDDLYPDRAALFEGIDALLSHANEAADAAETGQGSLFGDAIPAMKQDVTRLLPYVTWDSMELLQHEFDAIGFYLSAHPLDNQIEALDKIGVITHAEMVERMDGASKAQVYTLAGVVMKRQEKISQKSGQKFAFLHLSDVGGMYEVMIFSDMLATSRHVMEEGMSIILTVDADIRDDQLRLAARSIKSLDEAQKQEIGRYTIDLVPFIQKMDLTTLSKQITEGAQAGGGRIILRVPVGNRLASVQLPKTHWIPPATMRAMAKNACVARIEAV